MALQHGNELVDADEVEDHEDVQRVAIHEVKDDSEEVRDDRDIIDDRSQGSQLHVSVEK